MESVWGSPLPSPVDIMICPWEKPIWNQKRSSRQSEIFFTCCCVCRSDSHRTSALTSRTFSGTCCRWIWQSDSETWRMVWATSRPTSGLPPPTGLLFTRERCGSTLNLKPLRCCVDVMQQGHWASARQRGCIDVMQHGHWASAGHNSLTF